MFRVNLLLEMYLKRQLTECKGCNKHLGLLDFYVNKYKCIVCNGVLCSTCMIKYDITNDKPNVQLYALEYLGVSNLEHNGFVRCCPSCYKELLNTVQTMIDSAKMIPAENVEIYSHRYKGKLPKHSEEIKLITSFYDDRDDAEYELKCKAAWRGCNSIINVKFNIEKRCDDNYIHKVFQYEGVGIK